MQVVAITDIKPNPTNPRLIKDDKFMKLVQSLKDFPEMANVRPIVVNQDMIILGGNMRYKAMKEAKWKQVPIEVVDWSEDKQREFIVKDNVGFGEWDWDLLANEWDAKELHEWGLQSYAFGHEANSLSEDDLDINEEFDPVGSSKELQRVVFIFDGPEEADSYMRRIDGLNVHKKNHTWYVDLSTQSIS